MNRGESEKFAWIDDFRPSKDDLTHVAVVDYPPAPDSGRMFSQTVEYALRAIVLLAGDPDQPRTSEQIAKVTQVPHAYLSKVMKGLCDAGLVRSQRGIHGGFTILKRAHELTILEVVNAVEPIRRIRTCPLGISTHGVRLCPLHRRLDDALASVEKAFGDTTLAEVLADPNPSIPLCEFPPIRELTPAPAPPAAT